MVGGPERLPCITVSMNRRNKRALLTHRSDLAEAFVNYVIQCRPTLRMKCVHVNTQL